jgi:hypothetical protein
MLRGAAKLLVQYWWPLTSRQIDAWNGYGSATIPQQTLRRLGCSQNACSRGVLLFPVHNLSPELLAVIRVPGDFPSDKKSFAVVSRSIHSVAGSALMLSAFVTNGPRCLS